MHILSIPGIGGICLIQLDTVQTVSLIISIITCYINIAKYIQSLYQKQVRE